MGKASNELFAQFFFRIYKEIPSCILASFSKLKYVNSSNFIKFRETFQAKFLQGFICPAYTFDNVKGNFPIGFLVWNLAQPQAIQKIKLDIFNEKGASLGDKRFYTTLNNRDSINKWIKRYDDRKNFIALVVSTAPDFQHNQQLAILSKQQERYCFYASLATLIPFSVYFSIRHCIPHTWINDRDQFLAPNKKWEKDSEFQNDCLAFMLFHSQNKITAKEGINHFIPFSEREMHAQEAFASHFMRDFLQGKIKQDSTKQTTKPSLASKGKQSAPTKPLRSKTKETIHQNQASLFHSEPDTHFIPTKPLDFSQEAKEVLEAGKELFKHYHTQAKDLKNYEPNASLYDIKAHFQGFSDTGKNKMKMNPPQRAKDEAYKERLGALNHTLKALAKKIESKVYDYGFLLP